MTHLSKCCSAPIKVAGGKEGTNWYECEKCGEPITVEIKYATDEQVDKASKRVLEAHAGTFKILAESESIEGPIIWDGKQWVDQSLPTSGEGERG